ncbi:MAG: DmsC/YnfH family molybdoenzyme membrane anchor subunit [Pseudomonadota bacterium]
MHPAFSVIAFTTLSGAGYGLLFWAAFAALAAAASARALLVALALALVLCSVGLLASLLHLGKPLRAWRAFSQWRTSWLSREGVLAMLTYVPAVLLGAALLPAMLDDRTPGAVPELNVAGVAVALLVIACALATVYCTAMIYASLTPIPAWRHRLVPPVYVGFALLTGGLMLLALANPTENIVGHIAAKAVMALALVLWLAKWRYWRDIAAPLPATRGAAVGLAERRVSVFERPHTEANYITREMAFVVARRHALQLRFASVVLFALVPTLCMLAALLLEDAGAMPWFAIAAGSALAGTFVERWLFFAEARHMVTLYY